MKRYDFTDEAKAVDKELSGEMEKLTGLSDDEIAELLPDSADRDQLRALTTAVAAEKNRNRKKAVLLERLAMVAPAVRAAVECIVKTAL